MLQLHLFEHTMTIKQFTLVHIDCSDFRERRTLFSPDFPAGFNVDSKYALGMPKECTEHNAKSLKADRPLICGVLLLIL